MDEYKEYIEQINIAENIFIEKFNVYGDSFSIFRNISMLEQIEIKLKRILNIQNGLDMKVNDIGDDITSEYLGIYNYCIQYLLRHIKGDVISNYNIIKNDIYELMIRKNHDYGSAWEGMHIWSLTDLMNVKIQRIKYMILSEMESKKIDNNITEGIESNIQDLANYSIFCLIKINREKK